MKPSKAHPLYRPGTVTLVGAGPGDPELLTLKAVRAIEAATVLLVDDLVSEDVVSMASPDARVVRVGKRGGCTSTPQAFIEKLMVMAAQGRSRRSACSSRSSACPAPRCCLARL